MLVAGATWLIVYNADVLLGATMRVAGRVRSLAPVLKMAMAYPLRVRFRTGVTLAMFTLVVFTIVVGATTSRAFLRAMDDVEAFGGGFDVTAQVAPTSPLGDPRAAVHARGAVDVRASSRARRCCRPRWPRPGDRGLVELPAARLRRQLPEHDDVRPRGAGQGLRLAARGLAGALAPRPTSPSSTRWPPRGATTGASASPPELRLHGFFIEDGTFDPCPSSSAIRTPARPLTVTVIGVLADTVPIEMAGLWTSQQTALDDLRHARRADDPPPPGRAGRRSRRGRPAARARVPRERHGGQVGAAACCTTSLGASYTLNWLLLGFMGLGLIVGVAALGVISARAVVERRQQIGVLRSIGFRRGMVQLSFLLESSFIALTAIVVGTALGLVVAYNVVADAADQPSWQGALTFAVPWAHLAIVFVAVFAAALLTTLAPAARAARVYPAEALRYE